MYLIRWEGYSTDRWLDLIPHEWLSFEEADNLVHSSLYNDKSSYKCYCELHRIDGEVRLDYTGWNAAKNEFKVGVSVIRFNTEGLPLRDVGWIEDGILTDSVGELLGELPSFSEGNEKMVQHKKRERSKKLRELKLSLTLCNYGKLACEVCTFDFNEVYGDIAHNYCEVHHNEKIAGGETINGPDDLAIVCANCHRAIHQSEKHGEMITVSGLKDRLAQRLLKSVASS